MSRQTSSELHTDPSGSVHGSASQSDGKAIPEEAALQVLGQAVDRLARNDAAEAMALLEPLCARHASWAVARAYLGTAYLHAARVAEALEELEAAVRLAPGSFICRLRYAEGLARLGFYDRAAAQLDAALVLRAPDALTHLAALELYQFCRERSKGLFYREFGVPRLPRLRLRGVGRLFRLLAAARDGPPAPQTGSGSGDT